MYQTISVNPSELSVAVGFPCGAQLPWQTAFSLAATVKACTQRRINVELNGIAGSSVVTWARDKVLDEFLRGSEQYLFWIDSDIRWEPADFIRLLVLSSQYGVVCAAYAQKTEAQTIVIRRPNLEHFDINPHGLLSVEGAGLGFTVVPRAIAEELAATKPWVYDPAEQRSIRSVFRIDTVDRGHEHQDVRHEDIAFFADIRDLGHPVWLDPTIQLGHVGPREYRNDPVKALRLEGAFSQTERSMS